MEQYLTPAEVATALRMSKMTVYRLCHDGELPHIRIGKTFRIPRGEFERWLEARRHPGGSNG